ncbi:MAG: Transforming protein p29 precursor [Candidatus Heimdallarchaeota archaeon LC_3]|nr:MAG: Transforming protein p29 precursor [Candidatus Heimdallarchaeota archaeon LC_3]
METFDSDYVFKIVAVGNGGTGKTSCFRRFALNKFETSYLMTLGVDFTTKDMIIVDPTSGEEKKIKLVLADTAGQEYYSSIRPSYYMGAQGCVIVFDLSNKTSYESLIKWIKEIKTHLPNILIAIIGNKVDLPGRRVTKEEGESFAKEHDVAYFETSAKEGTGIDIVFNHMTSEILKKIPKKK